MASEVAAPTSSSSIASRGSSHTSRPSLTIDISNLPPLSQPSPPSNTLLLTDLRDRELFSQESLAAIRAQITAIAPLNSFSPLPSLQRIVCSFTSTDDAVRVRRHLEAELLLSRVRTRIYFGEHTPIADSEEAARQSKLLQAPNAEKLFFISPPPSPPHGWVSRTEEPPNKQVHAQDLAEALARLSSSSSSSVSDKNKPSSTASEASDPASPVSLGRSGTGSANGRSRSSTLIYHPQDHGGSPDLPAVMVEDTSTRSDDEYDSDVEMMSPRPGRKPFPRTARPPVELME
ncbi:hypothetical protein VTN49DRAFT_6932 [Thermomyces lanuginosus]|uniref:uncharacterized protein n=1 Tax=Thermomyces lanuginosus TaxID=5541 RepID=UPI00374400E7